MKGWTVHSLLSWGVFALLFALAPSALAAPGFPQHQNGRTSDLYGCRSSQECRTGSYCVDNGGDGRFYCKPSCEADADCASLQRRFPGMACFPAYFRDGQRSSTSICNEGVVNVIDYYSPDAVAAEAPAASGRVEIEATELDAQIAEDAGLIGQLTDQGGMDRGLIVDEELLGGIGGDLGAEGIQIGSGGLGSRGSGLGGGGSASGFGSGGGNFGARSEGGIGRIGGEPIILGALDKSLIDPVIRRNMAQIRYCYTRELNRSPTLEGRIVVKFVIRGDGTVSRALTHSSTMAGGDAVQSCLNSRFMRFQFPEPRGGGIVIVKYPFLFAPQ